MNKGTEAWGSVGCWGMYRSIRVVWVKNLRVVAPGGESVKTTQGRLQGTCYCYKGISFHRPEINEKFQAREKHSTITRSTCWPNHVGKITQRLELKGSEISREGSCITTTTNNVADSSHLWTTSVSGTWHICFILSLYQPYGVAICYLILQMKKQRLKDVNLLVQVNIGREWVQWKWNPNQETGKLPKLSFGHDQSLLGIVLSCTLLEG